MISKELLSEVLGDDITDIWTKEEDNFIGESFIVYFGKKKKRKQLNIYELAHKCKEWVYDQEIGKDEAYYNGCGRSNQQKMYEINIITKKQDEDEYIALIDNGKDLNCSLEFYGLSGRDNHPEKCFNRAANKVNEVRFYAETEPEAIFKAAQWILEQKDNQ